MDQDKKRQGCAVAFNLFGGVAFTEGGKFRGEDVAGGQHPKSQKQKKKK